MVTKFLNISTDTTLSENSNTLVPSQKAVKSFIASKSIHLNFLQSTVPTTYAEGNLWLNTSDCKVYTARSSSTWDSGVLAQVDQFFTYLDLLYYYDGTSIKSYSVLSITEQRAGAQVKEWLGTRAQYEALGGVYEPNTKYEVIESGVDYALLASQTQFNNSSSTTAATPYQVNQALGNYLPKSGGNLNASAVLRLTNANNEVTELAFNTSGQLTISTGLYVTNALDVNSIIVRAGTIYKTNTSGATAIWSDTTLTTSNFTGVTGYDSSKTQVLKHVNGTLQWVDEV